MRSQQKFSPLRPIVVICFPTWPLTGSKSAVGSPRTGTYGIRWGFTCFVGYCVGFGHRLLVAQIDRGAPLKCIRQEEIQCMISLLWFSTSTHPKCLHRARLRHNQLRQKHEQILPNLAPLARWGKQTNTIWMTHLRLSHLNYQYYHDNKWGSMEKVERHHENTQEMEGHVSGWKGKQNGMRGHWV